MKKIDTLFSFSSYHTKLTYAVLSFAGFLFAAWSAISAQPDIKIFANPNVRIGFVLMSAGLFGMAFSQERIDDERVKEIRHVVMRNCLRFLLSVMWIISLKTIAQPDFGFKY